MTQRSRILYAIEKSTIILIFLGTGFCLIPVQVQAQTESRSSAPTELSSSNSDSCKSQSDTDTTCHSQAQVDSENSNTTDSENSNSSDSTDKLDSASPSENSLNPSTVSPETNKLRANSTSSGKPVSDRSATDSDSFKSDPNVLQPSSSSPPSTYAKDSSPQSSADKKEESSVEKDIVKQINEYRLEKGLSLLQLNSDISALAKLHSEEMATGEVPVGHQGFKGRIQRLKDQIPLKAAGENVAYSQGAKEPALQAVQGWLKSPEHKKNIEGKYNLTGIGVAKEKGKYYFTQIFASSSKNNLSEQTSVDESSGSSSNNE